MNSLTTIFSILTEITQSLTFVFRAISEVSFSFVRSIAVICSGENT